MASGTNPSRRLVEQRVRNRIIEYLELASSFEAQTAYQAATIAHVPREVINQWEDWSPLERSTTGLLAELYARAEIEAMHAFHREWAWVSAHTPNPLPELPELQRTDVWQRLREAAETALRPFEVRGRLPEDREA